MNIFTAAKQAYVHSSNCRYKRAKGSLNSSSPKRDINSCLRLYGKLLQPSNAKSPILVTLFGMTTSPKEVQQANALSPILVTLSGMTILDREVQSANALFSMLTTLFGIMMLVKELQPENAPPLC